MLLLSFICRQFDFREPHTCHDGRPCNNVLINVGHREQRNYHTEVKCIAVNSMRPELLAIGCNDQYVRLYDTRMLTVGPRPTSETVKGYIRSFTAGHLNKQTSNVRHSIMKRPIACTYVTFSPNGQELLANLGGEQVYLFDVLRERTPTKFTVEDFQISGPDTCHFISNLNSSMSIDDMATSFPAARYGKMSIFTKSSPTLVRSESLRIRGNDAYNCREYSLAIQYYNIAILWDINNPTLYSNRAAAYLARGW